jgi:hypothetical protein
VKLAAEEVISRPWAYPGLEARTPASLLLSFSRNESLGVWSSWFVFAGVEQFFVRRIEWARSMDRVLVVGVAPSTFGSEAPLSKSSAVALLKGAAALANLETPVHGRGFTLDGARSSVSVWRDGYPSTASWQSRSVGSEACEAWLEAASAAVNSVLPQSSAHMSRRVL